MKLRKNNLCNNNRRQFDGGSKMIMLQIDGHGCVYSIDSEGALYMTPINENNSVRLDDWDEIDFLGLLGEEESIREEIEDVHQQLIEMNKAVGCYFKQ